MTIAWVLGQGGLIGSALLRMLQAGGTTLFRTETSLRWDSPCAISKQFQNAIAAFSNKTALDQDWEIYWAAGRSSFSSSQSVLDAETELLSILVDCLVNSQSLLPGRGSIAFVSSAGGIYSGSRDRVLHEGSPVAPLNAYGQGKLDQESLLIQSKLASAGHRLLLARASTLYGPGQAMAKAQGLISRIARAGISRETVPLYVSMQTLRDYLYTDDAARIIIASLRSIAFGEQPIVKIVASGQPASVAEVLRIYRLVLHRRPLWISVSSPASGFYDQRQRYRSMVYPELNQLASTSLAVGIQRIIAAEQHRFI
ncbi:MAG: NAD-dependent epimerase/dehydratase family protein [Cyanobacteriota bacterium]|nr:NAD-dependent epimerase/dehydratase family protein [Cyanobacteriota bacterium]